MSNGVAGLTDKFEKLSITVEQFVQLILKVKTNTDKVAESNEGLMRGGIKGIKKISKERENYFEF